MKVLVLSNEEYPDAPTIVFLEKAYSVDSPCDIPCWDKHSGHGSCHEDWVHDEKNKVHPDSESLVREYEKLYDVESGTCVPIKRKPGWVQRFNYRMIRQAEIDEVRETLGLNKNPV